MQYPENTDLANKVKILFLYSEADRERVMASWMNMISRMNDNLVAFCYESYPNVDCNELLKEMESELARMDAVICAVSVSLLSKDSCEYRLLKKAIERKMHVMPWFIDSDVSKIWFQIDSFHSIQYINPYHFDPTEIPASIKLQNWIDKLVNNYVSALDLAWKSLDGYFFLSYRKKNRQYVDRLLTAIHGEKDRFDQRLVSIGLWYDEYLVPGESYSQQIDEMLKGCDAVILLVTPEILEDGNYVRDIEYKRALEEGKKVIPVLCKEVDEKLLRCKDYFEGLDECISLNDGIRLRQVLSENVSSNNKVSGEKLYNLATAYTKGIWVNKNMHCAEMLFLQACKLGFIEGYNACAKIYEELAVSAINDYPKAELLNNIIAYHNKYQDCFEEAYIGSHITMSQLLNIKYLLIKRIQEIKGLEQYILSASAKLYEEIRTIINNGNSGRELLGLYGKITFSYVSFSSRFGNDYFRKNGSLAKLLDELLPAFTEAVLAENNFSDYAELSQAYKLLSDFYERQGAFTKSFDTEKRRNIIVDKFQYNKDIESHNIFVSEAKTDLAESLERLGDCNIQGAYGEAITIYLEAKDVILKGSETDFSLWGADALCLLARINNGLGRCWCIESDTAKLLGNYENARLAGKTGIACLGEAEQGTCFLPNWQDDAKLLMQRGIALFNLYYYINAAFNYLNEAGKCLDKAAKTIENTKLCHTLIQAGINMAFELKKQGKFAQAYNILNKMLQLFEDTRESHSIYILCCDRVELYIERARLTMATIDYVENKEEAMDEARNDMETAYKLGCVLEQKGEVTIALANAMHFLRN